jgi:hypothetical protein
VRFRHKPYLVASGVELHALYRLQKHVIYRERERERERDERITKYRSNLKGHGPYPCQTVLGKRINCIQKPQKEKAYLGLLLSKY